jgi:hypothetical protein
MTLVEITSPPYAINGSTASFDRKAGIGSFTELRLITIETEPDHFPI